MPLIKFTSKGLYCPPANVYIDPWRKVDKAIITHGHSDHARPGMKSYLCAEHSLPILKVRLGKINVRGIPYGESITINGVSISFHPAGHILGSAQVRVSYKGEIWVISGDYKTENDGISGAFEPVKCHHFVTETTFGLPVYQWQPQGQVFSQIHKWWENNKADNRPSIIHAYSLGKAQRILHNIDNSIGEIFAHPAILQLNKAYEEAGKKIIDVRSVHDAQPEDKTKALFITPSSGESVQWMRGMKNPSTASASGWMQVRGARRRRNTERGFVLSDHADWNGLNDAIDATGAENIYVTHGYTSIMKDWLTHRGLNAAVVSTEYGEEHE